MIVLELCKQLQSQVLWASKQQNYFPMSDGLGNKERGGSFPHLSTAVFVGVSVRRGSLLREETQENRSFRREPQFSKGKGWKVLFSGENQGVVVCFLWNRSPRECSGKGSEKSKQWEKQVEGVCGGKKASWTLILVFTSFPILWRWQHLLFSIVVFSYP